MRVLLDTHVFLWLSMEPERLSRKAAKICGSADLVVSVATVWEIGIKYQIGRLGLDLPLRTFTDRHILNSGLEVLPIHYRHALRAAELALAHKDPFDRMLAAQSLEDELPIVTRDPQLTALGATTIW